MFTLSVSLVESCSLANAKWRHSNMAAPRVRQCYLLCRIAGINVIPRQIKPHTVLLGDTNNTLQTRVRFASRGSDDTQVSDVSLRWYNSLLSNVTILVCCNIKAFMEPSIIWTVKDIEHNLCTVSCPGLSLIQLNKSCRILWLHHKYFFYSQWFIDPVHSWYCPS